MLTLLAIVHVLIGIGLILFVLLQDPKGGAMGVFGGGSSSNSFFGASGASNFLTDATKWLAVAFAISCLTLTYVTAKKSGSVMDTYVPPPVQPQTEPVPGQQSLPGTNPALDTKAPPATDKPAQIAEPPVEKK
ncbi:MAG: preprotein translocase subunit SecG [Bdellovibrionales bacterium]|nr:preprotein translocase subunit SecG [Bdellovibrionales bacterium]